MIKVIQGKCCHIHQGSDTAPVFWWGISSRDSAKQFEAVVKIIRNKQSKADYTLIAYEVEDWNRDFSPWEAPAVWGEESFAGGGNQTLRWLTDQAIPYVEGEISTKRKHFPVGYSLAGLFSLWAFYESNRFAGVASCSGSLWFPGWREYMELHKSAKDCIIYLSLGIKEEQTKNKIMAQVGECTRAQYEWICRDENASAHILEWNSGGHFSNPEERLAKSITWILQHDFT